MTPIVSRLSLALVVLAACDLGDPSVPARSAPPSVVRVTWDDGARDNEVGPGPIEVWAPIDVWFDSFLEPDSVTPLTVMLVSNGLVLRATVLYDVLDRRVRLTPAGPLEPNLALQVVVTEGIRALEGPGGVRFEQELTTGSVTDAPDEPFPIGWGELQAVIQKCGGGTCHGDDKTVATCDPSEPWRVAVGLELDSPEAFLRTAIEEPSRQWPDMLLIEPGRPDRSYLNLKVADFHEEVIFGNVMPSAGHGAGFDAGGNAPLGGCCTLDELPILHPPPWAPVPSAKYNPDALRRNSLELAEPSVWACACADTRERFAPVEGRCRVLEGECGNGADDDDDGREDCADPDCHFAPDCPHTTNCDPDGDGFLDCTDPDCAGAADCEVTGGCSPDANGDLDCRSEKCAGSGACPSNLDCGADCADEDCRNHGACAPRPFPHPTEGECDDERDDDADGATDCDDFDCAFESGCRDKLPEVATEPVAYCRARLISDWILEGAFVGQERRACEPMCAFRSQTPAAFGACVDSCVAAPYDEDTESCVQGNLCPVFDGALPEISANGLVQSVVRNTLRQPRECAVTCRGREVVSCARMLTGASNEDRRSCQPACASRCESLAELGDELLECGLGGT